MKEYNHAIRYIQLLELLQENMEEFENMQTLASEYNMCTVKYVLQIRQLCEPYIHTYTLSAHTVQSILNIHNNNEVDNDTNKNISVDQDTLSYQLHQSS